MKTDMRRKLEKNVGWYIFQVQMLRNNCVALITWGKVEYFRNLSDGVIAALHAVVRWLDFLCHGCVGVERGWSVARGDFSRCGTGRRGAAVWRHARPWQWVVRAAASLVRSLYVYFVDDGRAHSTCSHC